MIIGIDPDREKSGVAIINNGELMIHSLTFFALYDLLEWSKEKNIKLVRIEAGWLNQKSNYHTSYNQSKQVGEKIAKCVGANHETGRKIVEMCEYLGIKHEIVKPIGSKSINAKVFKQITGYDKRTNQDQRDAVMLIYNYKI